MFITAFLANQAFSQDTIYWNSANSLRWEDFKGKPVENTWFQALTSTGITYTIHYNNNITGFNVRAYFVKSNSWRKAAADTSVLRHEQGHFNITEIYARQIRKAIQKIHPGNKPVKEAVETIADNFIREKNAMQQQYDYETNFGTNQQKQAEWDDKIAKLLQ